MTSAADLFALQEIDLRHDSRLVLITDIDARLGETEELLAARETVQTAEGQLERLRRDQRDIDGQLADLDAKIAPIEKKLYDGSVRNPKDLTDHQRELNSLKVRRDKLDDEGLALLDQVEAATATVAEAKEELRRIEAYWQADQEELRADRTRAEAEHTRLQAERDHHARGMDPPAIRLYESLRSKKQGRAVARVERGVCQGCRTTLPTMAVQQVRTGSILVQCPRCERILVTG